jgi:hypothetical protein
MNRLKRTIFFLVILLSFFSGISVMADDLKIITPYWGIEENTRLCLRQLLVRASLVTSIVESNSEDIKFPFLCFWAKADLI